MVTRDVGGRGEAAYLAVPEGGRGPGLLLLHAWWGLNEFIRGLADRLAGEGYVTLAPDYAGGIVAASIEHAKALRSAIDRKKTSRLVHEALAVLLDHPATSGRQAGVIAFSLGCGYGLGLARSKPKDVAAVVLFYGTGGGKYEGIPVDFLGHFAEKDGWGAHAKKVQALEDRLSASAGSVEFHTYAGTGHWFFESDRQEAYHKDSAELAWRRTLDFLGAKLK
jgi:carboxymethylenebutenolidase